MSNTLLASITAPFGDAPVLAPHLMIGFLAVIWNKATVG